LNTGINLQHIGNLWKESTFDRYCCWQGTLYYYSNYSTCELQGRFYSWFCVVWDIILKKMHALWSRRNL